MDAQRLVLILSLAAVTYMMVLAWNDDYGQPIPAQTQSITASSPSTPVLSRQDSSTEQQQADIPLASSHAPEDVPSAGEVPLATTDKPPVNELIVVETDVLFVQIDPVGGDIVHVALKAYPRVITDPDNPFVLLEQSNARTFIAQSGLIGKNGPDASTKGRPRYQTFSNHYQLAEGKSQLLVKLTLEDSLGTTITKTYEFKRGDYLIDMRYQVNNHSMENWQASLFAQLKRDNSDDPSTSTKMGMASFLGAATTNTQDKYLKLAFEDFVEEPYKQKVTGGWIAVLQHYFVSAWIPDPAGEYTYQTRQNSRGENIAGLVSAPLNVLPGASGTFAAQFYAGPKTQSRLGEISPGLELTIDYGWLWFIAQPLFWILSKLHGLVGNWGWAIILTTLVVKLGFYRLSATSYKSMANMRRVSPELQSMKERYGDNRQEMSKAMMDLYKKEKINPLGGCLPILVQMPVFISLYWVLLESVELRHSPFIFWLNDLSVKDPYFILPILMGITMFIQQTLNPEPPDPIQAKVMKMMPIMFTFFFLWFPSGLVLYWLANNILSIAQQWTITRQIEKAASGKT